jgi:hypothetical protein
MSKQDRKLLKQFSRQKPCYYCGAPSPSQREHAPIKSLFEAFECDSITVPSCENHNTTRCKDDKIIKVFLLQGLYSGLRRGTLTENQIKALERVHDSPEVVHEVNLQPLVRNSLGLFNSPFSFIDETGRIRKWMRQLTSALVWSVVGWHDPLVDWDEAIGWSPEYIVSEEKSIEYVQQELSALSNRKEQVNRMVTHWWRGWSAYPRAYPPDIYCFQIGLLPARYWKNEGRPEVIFRHWFYGTFSWYVRFESSRQVQQVILDSVRRVSL